MTGPDFIVIGAMKSGTTTLADQLAAQDGVFVTTPKEPNYFSDDAVYAKGPDWYAALFDPAPPSALRGEASTHYTKRPTYPDTVARLHDACPELRLIYMIRNPVERAVSHYIHEWSERRVGGRIDLAFAQMPELVDYGRYAYQLDPYLEAFGQAAIHLTSLEQITQDPQAEFARIARFLDLPPGAAWKSDLGASNVSARRIRTFPLRRVLVDNPVMRPLRQLLIPKSVRVWVWNRLTMKKRPELPQDLRVELEQTFLEDREDLARVFPGHPALDLCYPFAST
ncbi:MAG: Sulfotransferase domain [Rhodobacteraceae bacterium HLUCCA08]|nr:MAG: Sulfotransferase domain [Rhodobacteraceae bacterium HLUCCA08]